MGRTRGRYCTRAESGEVSAVLSAVRPHFWDVPASTAASVAKSPARTRARCVPEGNATASISIRRTPRGLAPAAGRTGARPFL